jgi:hypothetical protein
MGNINTAKIVIWGLVVVLIGILVSAIFQWAHPHELMLYIVSFFSAYIAVLALFFSAKTYFSIDSVDAMSKMDGNVMENENYRTSIFSIICKFDNDKTGSKAHVEERDKACDGILKHLEELFSKKNIKSGATLADGIQNVLDVVVLLAPVLHRNDKTDTSQSQVRRLHDLVATIDRKVKDFESVSVGSCILINESVKLVKAVLCYQCRQCNYDPKQVLGDGEYIDLTDVRGTMLKNAVSRTLYYNYMGLTCLRKAQKVIAEEIGGGAKVDVMSLKASRQIKGLNNRLIWIYLNQAAADFDKALAIIDNDLMWNTFIQYNKARVQYLLSLVRGDQSTEWMTTMEQAIDYRQQFYITLDDMISTRAEYEGKGRSKEKGFFQRYFYDEYILARLSYMRMCCACGHKDRVDLGLFNQFRDEIECNEFKIFGEIVDDLEKNINN